MGRLQVGRRTKVTSWFLALLNVSHIPSYNNGTAHSPRINEWTQADGTLVLQDFHSGGTVCSPTRATILTGRNHFRDCVDFVYGCSDMTECTPDFEFSAETFTIGDAVRAANKGHTSMFGGKVRACVASSISQTFCCGASRSLANPTLAPLSRSGT